MPRLSLRGRTASRRVQATPLLATAAAAAVGNSLRHGCFLPHIPFTYKDCCRQQGAFGLQACFDEEYTFERCCSFRFGPSVVGLPLEIENFESVYLDVGPASRLELYSSWSRASASMSRGGPVGNGASTLWMTSWYFARLFAEPFGAPMRMLDIGCGSGLASLAMARAGHNVTAVDISAVAARNVVRNMWRNGVRVSVQTWNFLRSPPRELRDGGVHFDVLAFSMSLGELFRFSLNDTRLRATRAIGFASRLARLPVDFFLFSCDLLRDSDEVSTECDALLHGLKIVGNRVFRPCQDGWSDHWPRHWPPNRRPRWARGRVDAGESVAALEDRCQRGEPRMSPVGWLEAAGISPPSRDVLVVW
eukprot:TRINITY_DN17154_c1_g1_i4.p1 TRINITY_DN17154_c1_g1~~TRINITY_DN17154_c1_g1_i4.p1  ORF type:complete len:362 (-),score=55.99 TRINITY_DN17154_c1_g1_i4:85-1170(-)